eukprot:GHVP01038336.1.p1 GENE.GHVP01038336.1~~GHVP01038336.1.p1  ORF type:complete len:104 (+),score=13.38 GHVP01038336.1:589-900(+)
MKNIRKDLLPKVVLILTTLKSSFILSLFYLQGSKNCISTLQLIQLIVKYFMFILKHSMFIGILFSLFLFLDEEIPKMWKDAKTFLHGRKQFTTDTLKNVKFAM